MTRGTFTIAVAFLCSTAAATEQEVTCESPCECSSAHGKGRWLVKNDPSSPPTDASAIQSVTPSDIFGWPGPDEGVLSRKEAPMALISCPECNSQVSDRAASCPKCGYPLGQEKSFAHLLVDCRWKARSSAMVVPRVFLAAAITFSSRAMQSRRNRFALKTQAPARCSFEHHNVSNRDSPRP